MQIGAIEKDRSAFSVVVHDALVLGDRVGRAVGGRRERFGVGARGGEGFVGERLLVGRLEEGEGGVG